VLMDYGADLSIKDDYGSTALGVAKNKDVFTKLTNYASSTLPTPCLHAIQDKLKMLIQGNKQQKAEIKDLRDKLKSSTANLSEQRKEDATIQDNLDTLKTTIASLSEQHKVELAATKEDMQLEMNMWFPEPEPAGTKRKRHGRLQSIR
jgi:regulator of replication initiation timing